MRAATRLLSLVLLGVLLVAPLRAGAEVADRTAAPAPAAAAQRTVAQHGKAPAAQARHCANGRPSHFYRDSTSDGPRGVEASGIAVWNKDRDACFWVTATGRFQARRAQVIRVVIDADRRFEGYEYEAWAYSPHDADNRRGAYLIFYTDATHSHYVSCRLFSNFLLGRGEIRIGIPKTCIGSPAHIRVQAMVGDITRYRSGNRYRALFDFVPNGHYTPLF